MKFYLLLLTSLLPLSALSLVPVAWSYAFAVPRVNTVRCRSVAVQQHPNRRQLHRVRSYLSSSSLTMVDQAVIEGAGIAAAGLSIGIGLVVFTEKQGERAKERAKERSGGLSENMATRIAGKLMEDVDVSSVSDLDSLTMQLELALKESGGAKEEELIMSEDDKRRITDEADDGW